LRYFVLIVPSKTAHQDEGRRREPRLLLDWRFALLQTLDRFAGMIAGLERSGPEPGRCWPVLPSVITAISPMAKTPGRSLT
jgi:hypothetical protein